MLSETLSALTIGRALFLLDMAMIALLWPLALATAAPDFSAASWAPVALGLLLYPLSDIACLYALGLYRRDVIVTPGRWGTRILLVAGLATIGAGAAAWLLCRLLGPTHGLASLVIPGLSSALASGVAARVVFHGLQRRGLFRCRLLILGAGRRSWDLVFMLRREGRAPTYDITFVHDPALGDIDPRLADGAAGRIVHVAIHRLLPTARRVRADQIVVAPDERRGMDLAALLECKVAGFPVRQYLSFVETEIRRVDLKRMEIGWLLFSDGFHFGLFDRLAKRALDLAVSLPLLVLFSPFLLLATVAIKLDGAGPVLYRQDRVTKGGRVFEVLKLRTMRVDAEAHGAVWAAQRDPRITRVGAFLRRTRIDEMPQLLNVLSGDMSLVGPRPERPAFVAMLGKQIPLYAERHVVKAGLTGWAQVNYPYGASIDDARSKLSYDLYYVKNFRIMFDLLILLQTIRVVLWPDAVR